VTTVAARRDGHFTTSPDRGVIRYSQVWEDHLLLERGLRVGPGHDVLSICAAGDNVLALLLREPRSITAVDLSGAQTALLELKLAALRGLSYEELVALVGARPCADRRGLYARIRDELPAAARAYWDANAAVLDSGVIDAGMAERYLDRFRREHVARLDQTGLARLLDLDDRHEQIRLWERLFGTPEFESAYRVQADPAAIAGDGRDATTFRYLDVDDVPGVLLGRMRHVCTQIPTRGNFYLERRFTGRFGDLALGPPYLRPESFDRLRALADRVSVVTGTLDEVVRAAPAGAFSAANLSDVFEYMSEDMTGDLLELIASRLRGGGRLAYWNALVPRSRPARLAGLLEPLREEARALWWQDRCPFYRDFQLEKRI
jgi:S-adenosylmethionine-diacylglycerol 3-amino-3-carboxypropyl transferase